LSHSKTVFFNPFSSSVPPTSKPAFLSLFATTKRLGFVFGFPFDSASCSALVLWFPSRAFSCRSVLSSDNPGSFPPLVRKRNRFVEGLFWLLWISRCWISSSNLEILEIRGLEVHLQVIGGFDCYISAKHSREGLFLCDALDCACDRVIERREF
ncbi:unnamed protein product, partial [Musa textilis]